MSKKILIITNNSYMLYRFRKELIEKLLYRNDVVLSMPFVGHEDEFKAMGVRCIETDVDRRGINPKTDFKLVKNYKTLLKNEKPDLVITYSIKPNIYAGYLCGKIGIPFYANVQGMGTAFQKPILAKFVTLLYRASFKSVKKVFFENKSSAEEFRKRHIMHGAKQKVLNGAGINLEKYTFKPYKNNDIVHFLYLGRIMKEKGMEELFSAVERLHSEGYKFILDMAGFFEDEYKETVEKLQKEGIAVFHGFQQEPIPFYETADCVVLPSYHEGMSNVLLEAAALGRVVITSDIPGCREAVEEGKTGILCRPKDADSLYNAMKKFIGLNLEEKETMGKAAREKMEREFDKNMVVAETIDTLGL